MADDRQKSSPDNPGLKVVPKRRASDKVSAEVRAVVTAKESPLDARANAPAEAESVAVVTENGESILLPLGLSSNLPQKIIAMAALSAIFYFGRPVLVPLTCALLLSLLLDPLVRGLQRLRIPRTAAALLVMLVMTAVLGGLTYLSYVRVTEFARELPKYSEKIKETIGKFREQSQKFEKAKQAVAPDQPEDKNAIKVKTVTPGWETASSWAGSLSETLLEFSFIPILAFFGLTWSDHIRRSLVKTFKPDDRRAAHRAVGRISEMVRHFIVGNIIVGAVMAAAFAAIFWKIGVPNALMVGVISGLLSLVPYLGVPLAALPPVAVSIGVLDVPKIAIILLSALVVHVLTMNVLFPKVMGSRMKLNPLVVTASLLLWGFFWGPMGLLLAVPITAALKIVCDHVETWKPLGELMGEG